MKLKSFFIKHSIPSAGILLEKFGGLIISWILLSIGVKFIE